MSIRDEFRREHKRMFEDMAKTADGDLNRFVLSLDLGPRSNFSKHGWYDDIGEIPIMLPDRLCVNCIPRGTGALCDRCQKLKAQYPELVPPDPNE